MRRERKAENKEGKKEKGRKGKEDKGREKGRMYREKERYKEGKNGRREGIKTEGGEGAKVISISRSAACLVPSRLGRLSLFAWPK